MSPSHGLQLSGSLYFSLALIILNSLINLLYVVIARKLASDKVNNDIQLFHKRKPRGGVTKRAVVFLPPFPRIPPPPYSSKLNTTTEETETVFFIFLFFFYVQA